VSAHSERARASVTALCSGRVRHSLDTISDSSQTGGGVCEGEGGGRVSMEWARSTACRSGRQAPEMVAALVIEFPFNTSSY
jgi:hypothetical protein